MERSEKKSADKATEPVPPEKTERGRPKRNRVPDYESLFAPSGVASARGNGFLQKIFRRDWANLLYSCLVYILKASPIWIMPLVTGDVIDMITARPEGYVTRIIVDAAIFVVMTAQNIPTHMWYSAITNRMVRNTTAGIKSSVVRKLQRLSITYHREMEGGKIQSKFLRDIDNIDVYYRNVIGFVLSGVR